MARWRSGAILSMTPPVLRNLVFERQKRSPGKWQSVRVWSTRDTNVIETTRTTKASTLSTATGSSEVRAGGCCAGPLLASHLPRSEPRSEGLRPPSDTGQAIFRMPHFPNPPVGVDSALGSSLFARRYWGNAPSPLVGVVSAPSADKPPVFQSREYCLFFHDFES